MTDHLDRAGAGLRLAGRLTGQHGTSGALGIGGAALAPLMPKLAVGTVDLEHGMTPLAEKEGRAGGV